jgi:hypothetical protein
MMRERGFRHPNASSARRVYQSLNKKSDEIKMALRVTSPKIPRNPNPLKPLAKNASKTQLDIFGQ